MDPESASQRLSIVDILCVDTQSNRFIAKMQVVREKGFVKRAQYLRLSDIDQRQKDSASEDLKAVTFLEISNFIFFPAKTNYLSPHQLSDIETPEQNLKDFSFSFLELPKFLKDKDHLKSMPEKWAYFFKHAPGTKESDLEKIIGSVDYSVRL